MDEKLWLANFALSKWLKHNYPRLGMRANDQLRFEGPLLIGPRSRMFALQRLSESALLTPLSTVERRSRP